MSGTEQQRSSQTALWQRFVTGLQAWKESNLRNDSDARAAAQALEEWLGAYPNQALDVTRLALSPAFTALKAWAHEPAAAFARVVIDASTFRALTTQDDRAAAALAALILAEARFEAGNASESGRALQYATALVEQMDATSALRAWVQARCDLIAGASAEAVLERRQAAAHYHAARETVEPLIRNAKLHRELTGDWLRVAYGNVQQVIGHEQAGDGLVTELVRGDYVLAALGAARTSAADGAADAAAAAAAACAEFGVPGDVSAVQLHAALQRLPRATRLDALDKMLGRFQSDPERHSQAVTAMLFGLRASTPSNDGAAEDLARAGNAAKAAGDSYAWTTVTADMVEHRVRRDEKGERQLFEMFLMAYASAEKGARETPRYLPFRAHFEHTLDRATADALDAYVATPSLESSSHLSACLETSRTPDVQFASSLAGKSPTRLEQARAAATDWLGRIVHAMKHRPDALVLVPASLPGGTSLLCITDDTTRGVEVHPTSEDFASAATALSKAMRLHFEGKRGRTDLAAAGRRAHAALPPRVQALLRSKRTILVVPDLSGEGSALPYELFHGPKGFLGITHVVARLQSLRDVATVLEPDLLPAPGRSRALCVAAPDTIPARPLRFAKHEVEAVRRRLTKASWDIPALHDAQLSADLLLHGLELGSLVHVAAHGEAFGGAQAILLPAGERLTTDAVTSYRGALPAVVYLSVCSVGASEYLGGGVSRGFAAAVAAKGAPVIVASQWPLQDAAAEQLATAFYQAALKDTVGEAMRSARAGMVDRVPPALWGSVILIGNPWYRLDRAAARRTDAATTLLRLASDSSADRRARNAAIAAARVALEEDPDDRRLFAAIAWAQEASAPGGKSGSPATPLAEQMAGVARDLGNPVEEALYRAAAADVLRAAGQDAAARASLDRAIDIAEWVARRDESRTAVLHSLLAQRQKLDLRFEVPEVKLASGMTINDRSNPAIGAVLELQHAVDQMEARKVGALHPRLPDRSLEDLCWNAVVVGQRNRFLTEFACAGFAQQLAARAVGAGWIARAAEAEARRVVAGLLRFLWAAQRMTHLERDRALGQARTLLIALEAVGTRALRAEVKETQSRTRIEQLGDRLLAGVAASPSDRFARTRDRLHGRTSAPSAIALGKAVAEFVADTPPSSALRAHRAAWALGWLLELAYEARLRGDEALADQVLAEYGVLALDAEGHFMPYLFEGFEEVRSMPLDPLTDWRYGAPPARSGAPVQRGKRGTTRGGRTRGVENRPRK